MKIRIVNLDFYMHSPIPSLDVLYSEFRGSSVNNVPIIRIYGSTEEGQKICLHVHGVFPYFYIPYDGQLPADGFLYQIATGLDKAINVSFGQISSNVQHVYKVSLVSGIPFYGYHPKKHQFLKIYFYNPLLIKRACTLLLNGSILGKIYQPHEAHIPYILQFMIDYNLHGMSFVDLSDLKYRIDKDDINEHPEDSTLPLSVPKMSNCRIEADTQADHILNRQGIIRGKLTINPGIKALWDDEAQRRRDKGESSQIEHCLTLNRIDIPQTATHLAYKNILEEKLKGKLRIDTSEVNQSVYPAETPPSSDISDASMIEECERISQTNSSLFDETITEDLVLDDDAQQLYNLLNDLRGDNVEGDSILSQIQKENDSDEEDGDLSLPLNATQTPKKIENSNRGDVQDFLKDSYFESLGKIPQLDGTSEEISENQTRTSLGNSSNETPGKRRTSENVKENNVTKKFEGKLYTKISLFGWLGLPNRTNKILMSPPKLYLAKTAMKKSSKYINIHRTKKRNPRQSLKIKTNALFPKSKRNRLKSSCAYCLNLTSDPELLKTKSSSPCIKCYFSKITTTPSLTNVSIIKREENEEVIGTEAEGLNSTKNQDESTKIGNRKRHENDFNSYSPSKCKLKLNEGKNINESSSIGERRLIQPNQSLIEIRNEETPENDSDSSNSKRQIKKKKESNIDEVSTVKRVENQSILSIGLNLNGENDRSEDDSISKRKMKKKKESNIDELSTVKTVENQSILSTAINLIGQNEDRSEDDSISKRKMKKMKKEENIDEISTLEIFQDQSILSTAIYLIGENEERSEDDSISKRQMKNKEKEKKIDEVSTLEIFEGQSNSSIIETTPNDDQISTKIKNEGRSEDDSISKRKLKKKKNKEKNIIKRSTLDIFGDESISSTGTTLIGDWGLATIENEEKAENDPNLSISKHRMKKKKEKNTNELSTSEGLENLSISSPGISSIGDQKLTKIENEERPEDGSILKRKLKKKKEKNIFKGSTFDIFGDESTSSTGTTLIGDWELATIENVEKAENDSNFSISKRKMKKKKDKNINELSTPAGVEDDSSLTTEIITIGVQDLINIENAKKPEDDLISKRKMKKKKKEKRVEGSDVFARNGDQDLNKMENEERPEDDSNFVISKRKMKKKKEARIKEVDIFAQNGDQDLNKIENEGKPEDDSNSVISKRKMKKKKEKRIEGGDLFAQNADQDLDKIENVKKSEDDTHSKRKMKKMKEKNINKSLTLDIFGDDSISSIGTTLNGDRESAKIENEENPEDDSNFVISKRKMKKDKEKRIEGGDLFAQNGDQDLDMIENEEESEDDTHSKRKMKKMKEKNIIKSLTLDIFGDESISSTGTTLNGGQGLDKIENVENSEDDPNFSISKRKMKNKETRIKGGDLFAQNGDQDLDKIENEEKSEDDTHSKRKMRKMKEKNIIKSLTFDIFGDESISSTGTTLNGGQGLDKIENGENSEDDPNFSISKRQMKKKKEKRIGGGKITLNGSGGLAQIENEENAENDSTIFSISKRKMKKKKKEKRIGGGGIDPLQSKKSKKHKSRRKREEIREIKNHQIYNIEDDRKMMKKKKHEDPLNMPSICDSPPSTHADNNNNIEIETIINEHLPKRRRRGRKRLASIERERLARVTPSKLSIRYAICNPRYDLRPRTVSTKLVQTRASPVIKRAYTKRIIIKPELKNKRTQTTAVQLRHRKPVLNITLLRTDKINEYTIKANPFGKYRQRIYRDLGTNPKPKFRIVAASQPYEFELRNGCKYPNTTWYKSEDEQGRVKVIEDNEVVEEGDKEGTMLDPLNGLEGEYNEEILPSGEFGIVNDLTELYDEIFQGQDASSSCLDMSKIFDSFSNSQGGGDEEEFTDSCRDGKSSFADNRRKIYKSYDDLMEKIGKSFDDLFCSTERITESNAISSRRILEYVQEMERKSDDKRVVVGEVENKISRKLEEELSDSGSGENLLAMKMSENDVRKGKSVSQSIQFNRIAINLENRMSPPFKSRNNNAKRTKRPPSPFYNIGVTSTNKLESGDIVGEKVGKFRQIGSESSSNRISEIDGSLGRNIFTSSAIKDRNERMSPPPLKNGNKFITSPLINWGMSPPPGQIGEIEKNHFSRMSPPPPINSGKKFIPPRIDGGMIPPLVDQNSCQIGENHFSRMSPPPPSSSDKILTSPRIDRGMIPPPLVDQDNSGQIRKTRGNCKIFDREEKEMENRFSSSIKIQNGRMSPPPVKKNRDSSSFDKKITMPFKKIQNGRMNPPPLQKNRDSSSFDKITPPSIKIQNGGMNPPPLTKNLDSSSSNTNFTKIQNGGMSPPPLKKNSSNSKTDTNQIFTPHLTDWGMSPPPSSSSDKILIPPVIDRGMISPPLVDQDNSGQVRKMTENCKIFGRVGKEMENRFPPSIEIENGGMSPPPLKKNRDSSSFNKIFTPPLAYWGMTPPLLVYRNNSRQVREMPQSPEIFEREGKRIENHFSPIKTQSERMSQTFSGRSNKILIPPLIDSGMIPPPLVDQNNSGQVGKNRQIFEREGNKAENHFSSINIQNGGMSSPPLKKNSNRSTFKTNIDKILTPPLSDWGMSPPPIVDQNGRLQHRKIWENRFSSTTTIQNRGMSLPPFSSFKPNTKKFFTPILVNPGMSSPPPVYRNNSFQVKRKWDNRKMSNREGWQGANHENRQYDRMSSPFLVNNRDSTNQIRPPPPQDQRDLLQDRKLWGNRFTSTIHNQGDIMSPPPIADQNDRLQHRKIRENRFSSTTTIQNRGMSLPPFSSFKANNKKFFTPILVNPGMSSPPPVYRNNSYQFKRKWDNRKMLNREGWQGANHENRVSSSRNRQYDRMSSPFLVNNGDSTNQIRPPPPQDQRDLLQNRKLWQNRFTSTIHNQGDIMSQPLLMKNPYCRSFNANTDKIFTSAVINEKNENDRMSQPSRNKIENPPSSKTTLNQYRKTSEHHQPAPNRNNLTNSNITVSCNFDSAFSPESFRRYRPPSSNFNPCRVILRKTNESRINPNNLDAIITPSSGDFADYTSIALPLGGVNLDGILTPSSADFADYTSNVLPLGGVNRHNDIDERFHPNFDYTLRRISDNRIIVSLPTSCFVYPPIVSPRVLSNDNPPFNNMSDYIPDFNCHSAVFDESSSKDKDLTATKRKYGKKNNSIEVPAHFPLNQYAHADGPNDSSSDEEEEEEGVKPAPKKACRRTKKIQSESSKYSPLRVKFGSPSKSNLQAHLNRPSIPFAQRDRQIPINDDHRSPRYKRKLDFSRSSHLNRTETEEKLACSYKPIRKQSAIYSPIDGAQTSSRSLRKSEVTPIDSDEDGRNEIDLCSVLTPYQKRPEDDITEIDRNLGSEFSENRPTIASKDVKIIGEEIPESSMWIGSSSITPYRKGRGDVEEASGGQSSSNTSTGNFKDLGGRDKLQISGFTSNGRSQNKKGAVITSEDDVKIITADILGSSIVIGSSLITPYQKGRGDVEEASGLDVDIVGGGELKKDGQSASNNLQGNFKDVEGCDKLQVSGFVSNRSSQNEKGAAIHSENDVKIINEEIRESSILIGSYLITPYQKGRGDLQEASGLDVDIVGGGELKEGDQSPSNNLLTPFRHDVKSSDSSGASGSDDIFSPTFDDLPTDLAEIYDVQKNFIPQAGTSKLSRKSINPQSSDSNTSTPQHPSSDSNRIKSSIREQIESSGSEVTPYQKEHKLTYNLTRFEYVDDDHLPNEGDARIIVPKFNPPSRDLIESTLGEYNIKEVSHQEPFYSDAKDVTGPMEIGLRVLRIPGNKIGDFPDFRSDYSGIEYYRREILAAMYPGEKITGKEVGNYKMSFCRSGDCLVTPIGLPPRRGDVELWLRKKLDEKSKGKEKEVVREKKKIFIACSPGADDDTDDSMTISPCTPLDETIKNDDDEMGKSPIRQKRNDSGQITGVTLDRTNNFAISSHNLQEAKSVREYLHLTVMCVEVIVETRGDFKPNPAHDTVKAIVYTIFNDVPEDDPHVKRSKRGCFLLDNIPTSPSKLTFSILNGIVTDPNEDDVKVTKSEEDLFKEFIQFFLQSDPDILMGYEVEMLSWGYLIERGYILNLNLIGLLARIKSGATKNRKVEDGDQDLTIPGRIILDFWRLLRHEIALQSYTFENIAYHVLHERAPVYSFKQLTNWWNQPSGLYRGRVLNYYYYRVEAILRITERLDLIGRTSELAKLFGIQFYEVLSRGSQFRVESMMLRLAKPLNYIAVSPGVQQKVKMKAPEFLPLIMEPESKFYADPVIVLDFQSLYPSMIIAYNLCFSTCLGRIEHLGGNGIFEFGAGQLKIARKYVKSLLARDLINITPCGVAFASKSVREGVLPRMLQEILDTRLMVKKSLKDNKGNKILEKVLDARQLGLKLIANVTYGYTAANFSGRMPCIEVADSVVSKGRETLQRAINLVEKTPRWGARVVYGDTDSMFVLVAGKSREDAFKIGAEIAEAVGEDNPSPVKLKLEKVFHPCILQTKKRYVGYIYESPSQERPEYCAKGIETVRRDGCPAVSKMLEKCLKILFDTRDVSLVRQYVTRQFAKILSGRIGIQDLTFAKEYRGSSGYRPGAYVPALELARKWLAVDKRSEPRRSERVPYVIINGPPGLPLIRLVRSPRELIADPSLRPNALYYITKVIIPPINRCFLLIGADLNNWFNEMPRKQFQYLHTSSPVKGKKSTISQYFSTRNCVVCGEQSKDGLCDRCISKSQATSVVLHQKIHLLEKKHYETRMICESCSGNFDRISCISLDCPVYYKRIQTEKEVQQAPFVRELIRLLPDLDF